MEISSTRPSLQSQSLPAQTANVAASEKMGAESAVSVAVKAAPEVPEFEKLDLDQAMSQLQDFVKELGRSLSFARDDSIDRSVITVRDTQTNQVVRQIPSEEVVAIARQIREDMSEMRAGLLLDKIA